MGKDRGDGALFQVEINPDTHLSNCGVAYPIPVLLSVQKPSSWLACFNPSILLTDGIYDISKPTHC